MGTLSIAVGLLACFTNNLISNVLSFEETAN